MKNTGTVLSVLILLLITLLSYLPSTANGFTNWDDQDFVIHNSLIKNLSAASVGEIFDFTDARSNREHYAVKYNYVPLTLLTFALEYHFFKCAPLPYHMTNLILHLANCLLLFFLILRLCRSLVPSFFTALLFGIHPLHVESVAWISERKDVLYGFFYLSSMLCYTIYADKKSHLCYGASLLLFLLSLLSKPMAVTLPALLLAIDYLRERKINAALLLEKLPFFILTLVFSYITATIVHMHSAEGQTPPALNPLDILFTPCYRIMFYLARLIAPFNLSAYYPKADCFIDNARSAAFLISPLLMIIGAAAVILSTRHTRRFAFGAAFFVITILPVVIAVPGYGGIKADRYTYIPFIGLFYMICEGLYALYQHKRRNSSVTGPIMAVSAVFLICSLSIMTYNRCMVWKDSITLWSDVLKHSPRLSLAYNNRGQAFLDLGNADRALEDFAHAMEYAPASAADYYNRSSAYALKGDLKKALEDLNRAIEMKPDYVEAYNNRGSLYLTLKDYGRAAADYEKALAINPEGARTFFNRAMLFLAMNDEDRALENLSRAAEIDRNYAMAYRARGNLRGSRKDYQGALQDFNHVILLEPWDSDAYIGRALTFYSLGDYEKAMDDVERLKKMGKAPDPDFIRDIESHLGSGKPR